MGQQYPIQVVTDVMSIPVSVLPGLLHCNKSDGYHSCFIEGHANGLMLVYWYSSLCSLLSASVHSAKAALCRLICTM